MHRFSFIVLAGLALVSGTVSAQDNSPPVIVQQQPSSSDVVEVGSPVTFSGRVTDAGGSGIERVFFFLRNLDTGEPVDVDGSVDEERVFRDVQLTLSDNDTGTWSVSTSLPAGIFRLYVTARDNERNADYWSVRTTITSTGAVPPEVEDTIAPTATIRLPTDRITSSRQFSGTATDEGGAGLQNVFYKIRNLDDGNFVSPDGRIENPQRIRLASLSLNTSDSGTWQINTSLPEGRFRFSIGARDNNDNANYWVARKTFDIVDSRNPVPDTDPDPQPDDSVFVASASDITDPADFYLRDGYEVINVIRMDVATRTSPGVCTIDDQSGCTLDDVLADTNGKDDFKVDIPVKLVTDDLPDDGAFINAGLRQRGASARQAPQKSFRIRLEDSLWRNEERIQLNKHPFDQSRMTNKLAFDLMQRLPHLPSLRSQFVNLWIDDGDGPVNQGLFTHIESRAKEYLINRGRDRDDNIYKANFFTFSASDLAAIQVDADGEPLDEARFEERIEIDRGDDHTRLVEMVAAINNPDIDFDTVLDRYFNRNNVLMWVTVNLLFGQDDVIDQNFYLYNPKGTEKFYFLPWDYDGALRVEPPLTDGSSFEELRRRLTFGFANAANNNFLREYYLLPGAHERIVRAATEVRREYFTDDLIRELSTQYASVIRPFISSSPDLENIGGVRRLERLDVWETRWQSFPLVVAANLQQLSTSPNMPLPHRLKQPYERNGNIVLWWERATDITGSEVTYDIEISSQPTFADGSIIFRDTGIRNEPVIVEYEIDRQSLPAGTWYYRVRANAGRFYQVANNQENEGDARYPGIRKFVVQ